MFFCPNNLKSENNNPRFKPWFDILLHTQQYLDSQYLEYLGYITLVSCIKTNTTSTYFEQHRHLNRTEQKKTREFTQTGRRASCEYFHRVLERRREFVLHFTRSSRGFLWYEVTRCASKIVVALLTWWEQRHIHGIDRHCKL